MFDYFRTIQAMPINFAVKIVQLKVFLIFSQSDDFALHSRSLLHLKLDKCLTCSCTNMYNSHISDSSYGMAFKLGMTVDICMAYMLMLVLVTVGWQRQKFNVKLSLQLNKQ